MTNLVISSSFKQAFKAIIKRQPNLKPKIEAKLRLLAENPYNPYYAPINSKVNYRELGLVRSNMIVVSFSTLNKIKKL
jgi:mRNA-degrading endonuclease YafQ of YafQ-DinJ toxin-antitoxin module